MANISLKKLITEAEDFQAKSKETGKLVHFKSKDSYQAAIKAGTHEDPKAKKGDTSKSAEKPNNMFGKDYSKDRGAKTAPKADSNWMDDLDSIDVSDVKGKADPNADSFTHGDLYGATFKDPETGKTITVGDAYEREDNSPAYQKAFAYVAKFDPDKEAVVGTQAYDDLNKKEAPKVNLPKKASELDDTHAESLEKAINAEVGLNGFVDTDDYTDAIIYTASTGNQPTYTLYFGSNSDYGKPDEFRVTFASTAIDNDPSNIGNTIDKPFKSAKDAMKYMIAVAKKYKKELEMDDDDTNESTKLTSMIKR